MVEWIDNFDILGRHEDFTCHHLTKIIIKILHLNWLFAWRTTSSSSWIHFYWLSVPTLSSSSNNKIIRARISSPYGWSTSSERNSQIEACHPTAAGLQISTFVSAMAFHISQRKVVWVILLNSSARLRRERSDLSLFLRISACDYLGSGRELLAYIFRAIIYLDIEWRK